MTKKIWHTLLTKSKAESNKVSSEVKASKSQLDIDVARGFRLDGLIEDYHSQLLKIQENPQSTQEVQAIRSFISQVHQLKSKNIEQINTSKQRLIQARQKLSEAEKERLKFNSLLDKENEEKRKLQHKKEVRRVNEQATLQFNLKKR